MSQPPEPPEILECDSEIVSCDGGGALGHPRVWLNMAGQGQIDCPYCDRRFRLGKDAQGRSSGGNSGGGH